MASEGQHGFRGSVPAHPWCLPTRGARVPPIACVSHQAHLRGDASPGPLRPRESMRLGRRPCGVSPYPRLLRRRDRRTFRVPNFAAFAMSPDLRITA